MKTLIHKIKNPTSKIGWILRDYKYWIISHFDHMVRNVKNPEFWKHPLSF